MTGRYFNGAPIERGNHVGSDTPVRVGRQELMVHPRHDLETTVVERRSINRDLARHERIDESIREPVLVRRVPSSARKLVVDLFLVEHRLLAEQRRRGNRHRSAREEAAHAVVERHEVLGAAQARTTVGLLSVVQPTIACAGPRRDLVDPLLYRNGLVVVERCREHPAVFREVRGEARIGRVERRKGCLHDADRTTPQAHRTAVDRPRLDRWPRADQDGRMSADVARVPYDEFSMFQENADEFGIEWHGPPTVRRADVALGDGRHLSALVWGRDDPDLVFLHGGAQNAHTWDTVALALDRPLLAIDLPGHGHSDGGREGSLQLRDNADDIATTIRTLAPNARAVIGMSLGGATTLALVDAHPDLVRAAVLVDVTPGVNETKAHAIAAFVNGPESFDSFDDLLARTIEFNPTRTESSLRRGILHNALQREDGSWVWRYARFRMTPSADDIAGDGAAAHHPDFAWLWDAVGRMRAPLMLVRGMAAQSVVDDDDEAELLRRCPTARVEHVEGAGHSVQGDQPVELARLIDDFAGPRR